MGGKSGPAPPDYTAAAERQAQSSREATTTQNWANRPDQNNPWGSTSWQSASDVDPSTGQKVTRWTQNTSLNPNVQGALDSQIDLQRGRSELGASMLGRAKQELGQPMEWGQFGEYKNAPNARPFEFGSAQDARARAEENAYKSATSRLDPQWQQRAGDLESQLANKGITRNSDAYSRAMGDFDRSRNDAYQQAQMGAISAGGNEAQRNVGMDLNINQQGFNQDLQSTQAQNNIRQQQIAEEMQRRGFSLNEINAAISGQQVSAPQFQPFSMAGASAPVNYMGAAQQQYQGAQDQWQNQNAGLGNILGAAGQVGSAFMFSDRRLKADVKRIGTHTLGFGIYLMRYIGETRMRVGVIAQEVQRYRPDLVRDGGGGVLQVNYKEL